MPGRAVLSRAGQGFGSFVETEKFGMKWRCASDDDCRMRRPRPVFNERNRQNSTTRFGEEAQRLNILVLGTESLQFL